MEIEFISSITELYEGPGTGQVVDEALYGMRGSVLERRDIWSLIEMEYCYQGWVHSGNYQPYQALRETKDCMVCCRFADVLQEPKVQAKKIITLTKGAVIQYTGRSGKGWGEIELPDGGSGYLPSNFLRPCQPPVNFKKIRFSEEYQCALRQNILSEACSYLGTQYRWGGRTPLGIDCSGLVQMAYRMNGIVIYRDARIQEGFPVQEIPADQVRPADLLYFQGHVAMYLGQKRYIHATGHPGDFCVRINSLDERSPIYREDLAKGILAAGSIFC